MESLKDGTDKLCSAEAVSRLCLCCGMCCNGVVFADVRFGDRDKAQRLMELGLRLSQKTSGPKRSPVFRLPQPCPAFDGTRCVVYKDRPDYCGQFECVLLKALQSGMVTWNFAMGRIAAVRAASQRVEVRLQKLEAPPQEGRHPKPLSQRFRHVLRWVAWTPCDPGTALRVGELTTAMHRLNLLLGRWFYPGH